MIESLWGEEYNIDDEKKTKKIINKIKEPKEITSRTLQSRKLSVEDRLKLVESEVHRILGSYESNTQVITSQEALHNLITKAIELGEIAIDTETNNSLDPITCKLMGLCLYVEGEKNTYIPVNHIDRNTKELLDNQIREDFIAEELKRLSGTKIIMHNGKFDYQVLKCTCGVELNIYWDTMIGAKLLDENERSAGLKQQYISKIDPSIEKYSIDELFDKLEYAIIDPELFALYAATDAFMTYQLYRWQMNKFKDPGLNKLSSLAHNLEMPVITVLADMELNGMEIDQQYAKLLSEKNHKILNDIDIKIAEELNKLKPQIDAWRLTEDANTRPIASKAKKIGNISYKYLSASDGPGDPSYWYEMDTGRQLSTTEAEALGLSLTAQKSKSEQLCDPINLASPTQLAILFYDVLKCPQVSKKAPRGTGEEELKAINKKLNLPLCDLLLQRREKVKLLTTYIDVIPELAKKWPDGRVRTHFNQYGAKTGRLSSSDPINFQNIPAHEKTIRMLFKAADNHRLVGADYSAQEPRLTAFYSQDENMINAYKEGKDLYSVIASMSFDRKYEDCLEFYPEGTVIEFEGKKVTCGYKTHQNKEGKEYRNMSKAILLGVLYGRGAASVGEQIGKSREEAQKIIDKFFKTFPKVYDWINKSKESAHKLGYVEDIAGRRRRLPDVQLDKYELKDLSDASGSIFNPLLFCKDRKPDNPLVESYKQKLSEIKNRKEYESLQEQALKQKIHIHDNTGFIAEAERQSVNSRVQGGAATLTKNALLAISRDLRMKAIGAKLVNTVHDEILVEVPEESSKECEKLLAENMINSAKEFVTNVPMKCDTYNVNCWYVDEYFVLVEKEFKKLLEEGLSIKDAFEKECNDRCESTRSQIYEIVKAFMNNFIPENVDVSYKSF